MHACRRQYTYTHLLTTHSSMAWSRDFLFHISESNRIFETVGMSVRSTSNLAQEQEMILDSAMLSLGVIRSWYFSDVFASRYSDSRPVRRISRTCTGILVWIVEDLISLCGKCHLVVTDCLGISQINLSIGSRDHIVVVAVFRYGKWIHSHRSYSFSSHAVHFEIVFKLRYICQKLLQKDQRPWTENVVFCKGNYCALFWSFVLYPNEEKKKKQTLCLFVWDV